MPPHHTLPAFVNLNGSYFQEPLFYQLYKNDIWGTERTNPYETLFFVKFLFQFKVHFVALKIKKRIFEFKILTFPKSCPFYCPLFRPASFTKRVRSGHFKNFTFLLLECKILKNLLESFGKDLKSRDKYHAQPTSLY